MTRRISRLFGIAGAGVGGSKAHHVFQTGRCLTVFDDDITTDEELVAALKTGRYRGAYPSDI
ncbi:MAG: hypothetical protein JJE48_06295 [Actinobacteria bacterium]|nr:hypothetical protein [Actinomycetota bacterium]